MAVWRYTCTQEEWFLCIKRGDPRRAGPVRIGVQTGLLGLIALYCLIGFFTGGMQNGQSLFVGLAAIVVGIVMLFVPPLRMRHEAQRVYETKKQLQVYLYEDGLAFGTPEEIVSFRECRPVFYEDMLLLQFEGGALLPVPKRVATEEEWRLLNEKIAAVRQEEKW